MRLNLNVQEPVVVVQEPQSGNESACQEQAVVSDGSGVIEEGNAAAGNRRSRHEP